MSFFALCHPDCSYSVVILIQFVLNSLVAFVVVLLNVTVLNAVPLKCHSSAEYHFPLNVNLLNAILLNVILLNTALLNVILLNVVVLNFIVLNAIVLNAILLNAFLLSVILLNAVLLMSFC
jgi:hypothetical protein